MKTYDQTYDQYKAAQIAGNEAKIRQVWAQPEVLEFIAQKIIEGPYWPVNEAVCHGCRNGYEAYMLNTMFGMDCMIGTDISDTAQRYPSVVQKDFNYLPPGWLNRFDFIYSNSFDHAYDPAICLDTWMLSLKENSFCFIEWWDMDGQSANARDCFSATVDEMKELIGRKYDYEIKEFDIQPHTYLFMIRHRQ